MRFVKFDYNFWYTYVSFRISRSFENAHTCFNAVNFKLLVLRGSFKMHVMFNTPLYTSNE